MCFSISFHLRCSCARAFRKVDLYESKDRGGIWCRDCPIDLIFPHLPEEIERLWIERGKPKVTIQEMPRLSTMLRDSGAMISAEFSSLSDLKAIAKKIIPCYSYAKSKKVSLEAEELAIVSFDRTNEFLARPNVMTMIRTLDKL